MFSILRSSSTTIGSLAFNVIRCSAVKKTGLEFYSAPGSLTIPQCIHFQQVRNNSVPGFFNKKPASQIWKGVSSVSNAGRRRGRGKTRGKKVIKDLNRGQVIGIGKENIRFPGLSAPIIRGRELIQRQHLPPDEKYQENLINARKQLSVKVSMRRKVAALDRGWSGGHAQGTKTGPPDPVGEEKFENFDGIILMQSKVNHMTGNLGRVQSIKTIVGVGNGNGLFGYAIATAPVAKPSVKHAKNRAAQKLLYVHRFEDRTIQHDFFAQFGRTKVFAFRRRPHYGLQCHRLIKAVCELIGIKDIHVRVEGSTTPHNVLNAFLIGLLRQKSFQELADETNLHVVEFDQRFDYFPKLLASPTTDAIESADETPDFNLYVMDNNIYHNKKVWVSPMEKNRLYPNVLRRRENLRGHRDVRMQLRAEYGGARSFLTEKFNECVLKLSPKGHPSKEREQMAMVRKITWKKDFSQLTK